MSRRSERLRRQMTAMGFPQMPVMTNRQWTCDGEQSHFSTVDESIAVAHMAGHFRRGENYRMVISRYDASGTPGEAATAVVEDVRGVVFEQGKPRTITLADVRAEATGELVAAARKKKAYHYQTVALIRVMVRDDVRSRVNGFDPAGAIRDALIQCCPSVRVIRNQGETSRVSGATIPSYRIMAESAPPRPGVAPERRRNVQALARQLANLSSERIDRILQAISGE